MRYLKKNTVKFAIVLARTCQENGEGTLPDIELDETGGESSTPGQSEEDTNITTFNAFLDGLSSGEYAELTALLWLGQENKMQPQDWDETVARFEADQVQDLREVSKFKLPQYLRHGMERLARFHRFQRTGGLAGKPETTEQPTPFTPGDIKRQIEIAGRFTLDSFNQKYGVGIGIKKLAEIMELKGYLTLPADRHLFGLAPQKDRETLESVLRTAEFPPPLPDDMSS